MIYRQVLCRRDSQETPQRRCCGILDDTPASYFGVRVSGNAQLGYSAKVAHNTELLPMTNKKHADIFRSNTSPPESTLESTYTDRKSTTTFHSTTCILNVDKGFEKEEHFSMYLEYPADVFEIAHMLIHVQVFPAWLQYQIDQNHTNRYHDFVKSCKASSKT
jgi:hypothetical protein